MSFLSARPIAAFRPNRSSDSMSPFSRRLVSGKTPERTRSEKIQLTKAMGANSSARPSFVTIYVSCSLAAVRLGKELLFAAFAKPRPAVITALVSPAVVNPKRRRAFSK